MIQFTGKISGRVAFVKDVKPKEIEFIVVDIDNKTLQKRFLFPKSFNHQIADNKDYVVKMVDSYASMMKAVGENGYMWIE